MHQIEIRLMTAVVILALFIALPAQADMLILPERLSVIEEEAFADNAAIESVILPNTLLSIGDRAFIGCKKLTSIYIPSSVMSIGEGILENCAEDVLVLSEPDATACNYALSHQIDCQCGTTYRALLIAQSYQDIEALKLEGPENDVAAIHECVTSFQGTPYESTICRNLTAGGIVNAIQEVLGEAKPYDVSLIYYSGHGLTTSDENKRGALLGNDGNTYITADQFRTTLDRIQGRKIVIIDACFSGNMLRSDKAISKNRTLTQADSGVSAFIDSFIDVFSRKSRASLAGNDYFVLTAASENELSYESTEDAIVYGLFTSTLLNGCGYKENKADADRNENGVLTIQEIYDYSYRLLVYYGQHVQVYPTNCRWFGIFRE